MNDEITPREFKGASTHQAKPYTVKARKIVSVGERGTNGTPLALDDGTNYLATDQQVGELVPSPGDYVVQRIDGFQYLLSDAVFNLQFELVNTPPQN